MVDIAGFPYFEVQFTKDGSAHDTHETDPLLTFLRQGTTTDLFVMSHGWNNDMDEARGLYRNFFACVRAVLAAGQIAGLAGRHFAVLGVLWPSKKFADWALIAGGAASAGSEADAVLLQYLDTLKGGFDGADADTRLEEIKLLLPRLENEPQARERFVGLVRSLLPPETQQDVEATQQFFTLSGEEVMELMQQPVMPRPADNGDAGGAATVGEAGDDGGAAGLIDFLGDGMDAALNVLNYATYYQMKERAGLVGRDGVNPLLKQIHTQCPALKMHLIGHSFGGRLVTATAAGLAEDTTAIVHSMTLLQAAFSHHGFAHHFDENRDGFFRRVITHGLVAGPIVITCTTNDRAVGKMYPLASLLAGQDAAGLFDKQSRFGGLGCHGAQVTPEASDGILLETTGTYQFQAGKLHNLNADSIIMGHSDICKNPVAHAMLHAVAIT
jgi:hypothetical protein